MLYFITNISDISTILQNHKKTTNKFILQSKSIKKCRIFSNKNYKNIINVVLLNIWITKINCKIWIVSLLFLSITRLVDYIQYDNIIVYIMRNPLIYICNVKCRSLLDSLMYIHVHWFININILINIIT